MMYNAAIAYDWMTATRYLGPAEVLESSATTQRMRVRVTQEAEPPGSPISLDCWAQVAVPAAACVAGDMVLVVGDPGASLYVIGLLSPPRPAAAPTQVTLRNGATVAVDAQAERVQVVSSEQTVLLEYDAADNRARVCVDRAALDVDVPQGDINFTAGRRISLDAPMIDINSQQHLRAGVHDAAGGWSGLCAMPSTVMLNSTDVNVRAKRGHLRIGDLRYTAEKVIGKVTDLRTVVERVESVATTVIAKAKNIYHTVEGLSQLRTGRSRTIVEGTYHVNADRALMRAKQDFKVNGEKIHLG